MFVLVSLCSLSISVLSVHTCVCTYVHNVTCVHMYMYIPLVCFFLFVLALQISGTVCMYVFMYVRYMTKVAYVFRKRTHRNPWNIS